MRYFATSSSPAIRDAMSQGQLGCIITPRVGSLPPPGAWWCADNGVYGKGWPGAARWWGWLSSLPADTALCSFAVAPDVVGDAAATLTSSGPWLPLIRELGMPAAYAAQDGSEETPPPWSQLDVLFIGGSTGWKLGPHARALTAEARAMGKGVHMGRVNSARRLRYAQAIGCTSADGTFLAYGPDVNLPQLLGWLRDAHHPTLWGWER